MSRLFKAFAVTAALLLGITACGADENDASVVEEAVPSDIVDVAVAADAFPTLVAALGAADLVDTLKGCLLSTSDAADDTRRGYLGGRRMREKNKHADLRGN